MRYWCVIARRRNGQQRIIDEHLSREAAEKLRDTLKALSLFPDVAVEIDSEVTDPAVFELALSSA